MNAAKSGSVTIKRVIVPGGARGGKSAWSIDGKDVKEDAVKALTKKLNIQIDNLCQFVPQEKVSAFADMTPAELMAATEEAAGGDELLAQHNQLNELGEQRTNMNTKNTNFTEELEAAEARYEAGSADYKRWEDQKAQKDTVGILEKKLPWLEYERDRQQHEEAKKEHTKCKEKLDAAMRASGDAQNEYDEAKKQLSKQKSAVVAHQQQMGKVQGKAEKYQTKFEEQKEEYQRILKNLEEMTPRAKKIEKRQAISERMIQDQQELLEQTRDQDVRPQLQEKKAELTEIKREIGSVDKDKRGVAEEKRELLEKAKRNEKSIATATNVKVIRQKNLYKSDYSGNVQKACTWLEDNGGKFKQPVINAICLHLEVKAKEDAKKVESMIPFQDMQAMLVQNGEDHKMLLSSMERNRLKVNVVKDPHPATHRVPKWNVSQLKKYGITAVVSDLFTAPDPVMRYLLYTYNLHEVPIGPPECKKHAEELFVKFGIRKFIAGDLLFSVQRSDYGNRQINEKSSYLREAKLLGGSVADEQQIKIMKEDQKRLRGQLMDLETAEKELNQTYSSLKENFDTVTKQMIKLKKMFDAVNNATQKIKRAENDLKSLAQSLTDLGKERVNYKKRLDSTGLGSVQEMLKLKGVMKDLVALSVAFVKLKLEMHDQAVKERVKKVALDGYLNDRSELTEAVEKSKEESKKKKAEARAALAAAREAIGGKPEPDNALRDAFELQPDTIEEVEAEILAEKAKLDIVAPVDMEVIKEHVRLEKEIEKMKKNHLKHEEEYTRLTDEIEEAKSKWLPVVQGLVDSISLEFGEAFKRLKCTGEVRLKTHEDDYTQYGIEIWVRFRGGSNLQLLQGTVQSGGEKSVSTMLYLMSLQSLTKCPFRVVDEINQGMDAKNERMIYGQVFHASENTETSQYFIISPKLLPNLEYRPTMRVLCVVNGPYVVDAAKMQMPAHKKAKLDALIQRKAGRSDDRLTAPRNRDPEEA